MLALRSFSVLALAISCVSASAQLGVGGLRFSGPAGAAQTMASSARVAKIASSSLSSLVVRTDGTVVAWGSSASGFLPPPVGLANVRDVSTTGRFTLALLENGTVSGWGENPYGNLDIPAGLQNVKTVGAGAVHGIALTNDGNLVGWGMNYNGVLDFPESTNIKAISIAGFHSLALTNDGRVLAWGGTNTYGELNVPAGLTNIVQVVAGEMSSHAVKADGTVYSWGQKVLPDGLTGVKKLSVSRTTLSWGGGSNIPRFLALTKDGRVIDYNGTWIPTSLAPIDIVAEGGRNLVLLKTGQIIARDTSDRYESKPRSLSTPYGLHDAIDFTASNSNLIAIRANGTIAELGRAMLPALPHNLINVSAVSNSGTGVLARRADGSLIGWGENRRGELVPPPGQLASFLAMQTGWILDPAGAPLFFGETNNFPPSGTTGLAKVAIGVDHGVGLYPDGSVLSWGRDTGGARPPVGTTGINTLAATPNLTMAVDNGGFIRQWGSAAVTPPLGVTNLIDVAAGYQTYAALRSDGKVISWGNTTPYNPDLLGIAKIGVMGNVTVGLARAWIEIRDGSCYANDKVTATVYLGAPAPEGGALVTLANDQPTLLTMPGSFRIPAGQQSRSFIIAVKATVPGITKATVACTHAGVQNAALLTIKPTTKRIVQEVSASMPEVTGGSVENLNVTIRLNKPAPSAGITVALKSSSANVAIPPSVFVAAGQSTCTIAASHSPVTSKEIVLLQATLNGETAATLVDLVPVGVTLANLSPPAFFGGESATFRLWLNAVMPTDTVVNLSVDDPHNVPGIQYVQFPATAVVPAGANQVDVPLTTNGCPGNYTYSTYVYAEVNGIGAACNIFIKPTFVSLQFYPTNPAGLQSTILEVLLSYPAGAGGANVALTSSSSNLIVPNSVFIEAGKTKVFVPVSVADLAAPETATVTATYGSASLSKSTNLAPNTITAFTMSPLTFVGGSTTNVTGTITLKATVKEAVVIPLESNNPCVTVPATVTVPAGQNKVTFTATHTAVAATKSVTIKATRLGAFKTVKLTVNP